MTIRILAFGIAKEIFGISSIQVDLTNAVPVKDLKAFLEERFPPLQQLSCYRIAVNDEFALDTDEVTAVDEIAIIPPVSGG